jgi:hypothetical protein
MPVTDLSQPGNGARVVNLAAGPSRGEKIVSGLATVALVAGTIAAGAAAAHAHCTCGQPHPKRGGRKS